MCGGGGGGGGGSAAPDSPSVTIGSDGELVVRGQLHASPWPALTCTSSQVLRPAAPPCHQLPQEEVWPLQQPQAQEESQVEL